MVRVIGCMMVCFCWALASFAAVEVFEVTESGQELVVENKGLPVKPTIEITGITKNGIKTTGPMINAALLADELLTGSKLTIKPDGTGTWEYNAGFEGMDLPAEKIDRYKYDIFKSSSKNIIFEPRGETRRLRLAARRHNEIISTTYRISFPFPIKTLTVKANMSDVDEEGDEAYIDLYLDRELKDRKDRYTFRYGDYAGIKHTFEINHREAYLTFTSNGNSSMYIYRLNFQADLDTGSVELPALETGKNVLTYTDDDNSSHRAKVRILFSSKPLQANLFDDLEDAYTGEGKPVLSQEGWTNRDCKFSIVSSPHKAYSGERYGKIEIDIPDPIKKASIGIYYKLPPSQQDWTNYKKVKFAVNCDSDDHGNITFLFRDTESGKYHVKHFLPAETTTNGWKECTVDISDCPRSSVKQFQFYTYAEWDGWIPGKSSCIFYIDAICLE